MIQVIVRVFRKLQQLSTSQVAPYLKQALLGATEYQNFLCDLELNDSNREHVHNYI
jgi:hypothetical protein